MVLKNPLVLVMMILFLVCVLALVLSDQAEGETLYVDDDGGADFQRIQDAVDNATEGDVIRVYEGVYNESVLVDRTLSLVGNGSANTTIDGGGVGNVVRVRADWCNVSGFRVVKSYSGFWFGGIKLESDHNRLLGNNCSGHANAGIYLNGADHNVIEKTVCYSNDIGIVLEWSDLNVFTNSDFSGNDREGIFLDDSDSNIIRNVTCSGNGDYGIYFDMSEHNELDNNTFNDNGEYALYFSKNELNGNIVSRSNVMNGRHPEVYYDEHGNETDSVIINDIYSDDPEKRMINLGYLILSDCSYFRLENITLSFLDQGIFLEKSTHIDMVSVNVNECNKAGIALEESFYIHINNTTCSGNEQGLLLSDSNHNTITNSNFSGNDREGIFLDDSDFNVIRNVTCSENRYNGILFDWSEYNELDNSTFDGNGRYALYFEDNALGGNVVSRSNVMNGRHPEVYHDEHGNETDPVIINDIHSDDPEKGMINLGYIIVKDCSHLRFENITLASKDAGIYLGGSTNIDIVSVSISDCEGIGIYLRVSSHVLVDNTTSSGNSWGIRVRSSRDNTIMNSNFSENEDEGIYLEYSDFTVIRNVTCSGNKDLGIRLVGSDSTVIGNVTCSGNGDEGISLWDSDSTVIGNVTCSGNGDEGIYITESDSTVVWNATCTGNEDAGVYIEDSVSTIIGDTTCSGNMDHGIHIDGSRELILTNNTLTDNQRGIYLSSSSSVALFNNTMTNDSLNIGGSYLGHWDTHTIDQGNIVDGRPVWYYKNTTSLTLSGQAGSIILVNCSGMRVENQELGRDQGIAVVYSSNIILANNNCRNSSSSGIELRFSDSCSLVNNSCQNSIGSGIELRSSDGCTLVNNSCQNNTFAGISLDDSNDNVLVNNRCSGNTYHGIDLDESGSTTITNSTIHGNARYGVRMEYAEYTTFTGNTISGNGEIGLYLHGCQWTTVRSNIITGNRDYGIWVSGSEENPVDALNNYWGHDSGPYHSSRNPAGKGDNVSDHVNFDPWAGTWRTVYNLDSGERYYTLQEAIDEAGAGDTIRAYSWTYRELIIIDKPLTLMGNGSDSTIIDGRGEGNVVWIMADWVNMSGFTVTGSDTGFYDSGIRVDSDHSTLADIVCLSNTEGIYLYDNHHTTLVNVTCSANRNMGIFLKFSFNNTLENCTARDNTRSGIHVYTSCDNSIYNCTTSGNLDHGIELESRSDRNVLMGNTCDSNDLSTIWVEGDKNTLADNQCSGTDAGIVLASSTRTILTGNRFSGAGISVTGTAREHWDSHTIDATNSVDGRTIYYFGNEEDATVPGNGGQVILAGCSGMRVENQVLSGPFIGISLAFSSNITVASNTCSWNTVGIYLYRSEHCRLDNNICQDGLSHGIELAYSDDITIENNRCSGNGGNGIRLYHSQRATLSNNSCLRNDYGVYLHYSNHASLMNNTCPNNSRDGIYLGFSDKVVLAGGSSSLNQASGINLWHAKNNLFTNMSCSGNGYAGLNIRTGSHHNAVWNSTFSGNRNGIYLTAAPSNSVHNNTIMDNRNLGILAGDEESFVNATNNWWGDNSGPYHSSFNPSGGGDNVSAHVLFEPWFVYVPPPVPTLYVDNSSAEGGDGSRERPFRRLQDAINASSDGYIIRVFDGIYNETIIIDRTISLMGNGSGTTTILNYGSVLEAVNITADQVNISGFSITRGDYLSSSIGIKVVANDTRISDCNISEHAVRVSLFKAHGSLIMNNTISTTYSGTTISLEDSHNNTIVNNTMAGYRYSAYGLSLRSSHFNIIENNNLTEHYYGVYLEGSHGNIVKKNNLSSLLSRGIYLKSSDNTTIFHNIFPTHSNYLYYYNIYLTTSLNCTLENNSMTGAGVFFQGELAQHWASHRVASSNTVKGKSIHYYANQAGGVVAPGAGQLILANCTGMVVKDQNLSDGFIGLIMAFSSDNWIRESNFTNNSRGMYLHASDGNDFSNITVSGNIYEGIYLTEDSYGNTFTDTTVMGNGRSGVYLRSDHDTTFRETMIANNDHHGIRIHNSTGLTLEKTSFFNNDLYIFGDELRYWNTHDIDTTNAVNGKPIYYYHNEMSLEVPSGAGQIILAGCSGMVVTGQDFGYKTGSMYLAYSDNNTIENNIFSDHLHSDSSSDGTDGIHLYRSHNNTIRDNVCGNNDRDGISLRYSNNNTMVDNTCLNNDEDGIYLENSQGNIIIRNDCLSNDASGIHLEDSHENTMRDNDCGGNQYNGIYLESSHLNGLEDNSCRNMVWDSGINLRDSENNTISRNDCGNNEDKGIVLEDSHNNTITENSCLENEYGEGVEVQGDNNLIAGNHCNSWRFGGGIRAYGSGTIIQDNLCVGQPAQYGGGIGVYAKGQDIVIRNNSCSGWAVGIEVVSSSGIIIEDNRCEDEIDQSWGGKGISVDGQGIMVRNNSCSGWYTGIELSSGSQGVQVSGNDCIDNSVGIVVEVVENATISGNTISRNQETGLVLESTLSAVVTNNTISKNEVGVYIDNVTGELALHGNDIHDNELFGLELVGTSTSGVNATGNWWGHRYGPYHLGDNPSGRGNEISGEVDFSGWSEEPNIKDDDTGRKSDGKDAGIRVTHLLVLTMVAILVLLAVVMRLPDEYFGRGHASRQTGKPGRGAVEQGSGGVGSCPFCGGRFEIGTAKRPIIFNCHFCGEEIEFR